MDETTDEKSAEIERLEDEISELEEDQERYQDEHEEEMKRAAEIREEMLELLGQIDDVWGKGRTVTIPAGSLFGLRVRDAINKAKWTV